MAYYTGPNRKVTRLSKSSGSSSGSDDSKLGSGITNLLKSPYFWAVIIAAAVLFSWLKYKKLI